MNEAGEQGPWPGADDALFDAALLPPARRTVNSAWYGHVPFAHWLVTAMRPRVVVELGTTDGVSYTAFCTAVRHAGLACRCLAEAPTADPAFIGFHDAEYGRFSRLLTDAGASALEAVADGSVDLLHVATQGVALARWRAKLSNRAVVLLHPAPADSGGLGWPELRALHSFFLFTHAGGLAVLAVGRDAPPAVAALCRLSEPEAIAAARARFAAVGELWALDARYRGQEARETRERELQRELLRRQAELDRLQVARLRAERDAQLAAAHAAGFRHERDLLLNSTFWRMTAPARALLHLARRLRPLVLLRRLLGRVGRAAAARRGGQPPAAAPGATGSRLGLAADSARPLRLVCVSGEPQTPGHTYRVARPAAAASALGAAVTIMPIDEAPQRLEEVAQADLLLVWRAEWNAELARIYAAARRGGALILYDVDDLILRPELARVEVIDGIRSQQFVPQMMETMFINVARAVIESDVGLATTQEIAHAMRCLQRPAFVLPNGFDDAAVAVARLAVRARRIDPSASADAPDTAGGLVRIGYAGGSRTHQRDFAVAAGAVARLLTTRPHCRLVLFRTAAEHIPLIDVDEYDALLGCLDQIEWRDTVPVALLGAEIARFDINLAPLEAGNPFCEAKSELKYFEAALVGVATIASPTGPFARAIRDGETGLLATSEASWFAALCRLADDPALRQRMAQAAYHDVLYRFGQQRREEMIWSLLRQLGGGREAGRAFALDTLAASRPPAPLPVVPASELVYATDRLGEAQVTVVIPLYNYQAHIEEALDSVARQTLALLDLVVVDDRSTDRSLALALDWVERHAHRFNRVVVLRNRENAGLGPTRNAGFAAAETPYVLPLDADNRLRPECCAMCLERIRAPGASAGAAFAYPRIQCFGLTRDIIGGQPFLAARLVGGNYIDAMALVAKWAWAAAGGYRSQRLGWEDYEFWCRLAEHGLWGIAVPEVLAEYRVHDASMLHRTTEQRQNKIRLVEEMQGLHSWLAITMPQDGPQHGAEARAPEPRDAA